MLRSQALRYGRKVRVCYGEQQERSDFLSHCLVYPTTSQSSVSDFLQGYGEGTHEGVPILSIHVSSKLSGTVSTAVGWQ